MGLGGKQLQSSSTSRMPMTNLTEIEHLINTMKNDEIHQRIG